MSLAGRDSHCLDGQPVFRATRSLRLSTRLRLILRDKGASHRFLFLEGTLPPKLWELWKTRRALFAESFPSDVRTVEKLLFGFSTVCTERQFPQLSRLLRRLQLYMTCRSSLAATASPDILRPCQACVGWILLPTTVLSEPSALQLYPVVRGGIQSGVILEAVSASSSTECLILSLDLCSGDRATATCLFNKSHR